MPQGPAGQVRSIGVVILLSIITFGIYALVWQYNTFKEMKEYSGQGIGGGVGLLLAIFVGIVNAFLVPAEIGDLFAGGGKEKPVSGKTGWWVFLPLVGSIIWVVKVQGSLNEFWTNVARPGLPATV